MRTLLVILLVFAMAACDEDRTREVTYRITDSVSGFNVRYLDENGQVITDQVTTQSAQDIWIFSFPAEDGGIVFVSANYKDPGSAIKVQVLVDGKIYKQAASKNDTVSFITVSGVIPIRE